MSKWIFSILLASHFAQASIEYNGDVIRNARTPFAMRHQGICHDEKFYYLIQRNKIWQIPRATSLEQVNLAQSRQLEIPAELKSQGANHLGDCEVDRGLLYVPLEGTHPVKMMIVHAHELKFLSAPDLPADQTHAPWVTVDPKDGSLLVGEFDFVPNRFALIKLQLSSDSKTFIELSRSFLFDANGNQLSIARVQAAKVVRSKNSLLILSDSSSGGILRFNLKSLRLEEKIRIRHIPGIEELEGLDAIESSESKLENISGNIIVTMVSHALVFTDRFYLKGFDF